MDAASSLARSRALTAKDETSDKDSWDLEDDELFDDWEEICEPFEIIETPLPRPPPEEPVRNLLRRSSEPEPLKTSEKVKSKLVGLLHKVQYGWRVNSESKFSKKKPIFLLGKCYDCQQAYVQNDSKALEQAFVRFKQDFTSRIWITYRQGFRKISGSRLTSDSGWGCMVRAAQMILAQAMVTHFISRDWTIFDEQTDYTNIMHKEIIRWFGDHPVHTSPFSLHRLVAIAKSINRKPGDWYGPACVSNLLGKAGEIASDFVPLLNEVCVYVGYDGAIYKQDVIDLATGVKSDSHVYSTLNSATPEWKAVVLLVPLAFGQNDLLCPTVVPCIKALFAIENFLGVIGGTPKHALYFIGYQGEDIIHLDPHYMQDTVDISHREFPLYSYHCVFPRKTSFSKLDQTFALGFYLRTRDDFENFRDKVRPLIFPADGQHLHPMFEVYEGSRMDQFAQPSDS